MDDFNNFSQCSDLSESESENSENYEIDKKYAYPLDKTKSNLLGEPKCEDCLVPLHWRKNNNICKGVIEKTISPFSLKHLALTVYIRKLASSEQTEASENLSCLLDVSLVSTYRIRFEEDFDACFNRSLRNVLSDFYESKRTGVFFEYQYNLLYENSTVKPYCMCFKKNLCACLCYCGDSRLLKYKYLFTGHTSNCTDDKIHKIFA